MSERRVLLEVAGADAGFGSHQVLHGVSFRVYEGEVAAILGLNGAGKSVTMKVVGGVVPMWAGSIRFDGRDIGGLDAEGRVAAGMAHVPQGRQVFPEFTIEQNLRVGAYTLRRRDPRRYAATLDSVLERFPRLRERSNQLAGTLSGGEQAMLAVGRALMSEPKLVLVDEASAGLAPLAVQTLFETLREVNRSGVTILMVEQNVSFALGIADRAHIMQQGTIVYDGEVAALDQDQVAAHLGIGRLLEKHVGAAAARRRPRSTATERPPRTKPAAKKAAPRKAAAKKQAAKKQAAKKPAAKKQPAKKAAVTRQRRRPVT